MSVIDDLLKEIPLPRVFRVRQHFERPVLAEPCAVFQEKLRASGLLARARKGMRIAVTAGSRGISDQQVILRSLVEELKRVGTEPFVIPAMGSHGGATAQGQRSMLAGMGITETSIGCPIRSTMETVCVGTAANGLSVYLDAYAAKADGIILVNRVKPHTSFRGRYESGLYKMIAIGLGKQKGAEACHQLGFGMMESNMIAIAQKALRVAPILFGVALIENAYHETFRVEVIAAETIGAVEPELLSVAKRFIPRVLLSPLDVLVINEIGKDISGTGFDTNAVGRYHTAYAGEEHGPHIARMLALDISVASHGNGNGLGILDFTTQRAYEKFDFHVTYPNSLTSTVLSSVKIPMVLKNDCQAIRAAIKTCNIMDYGRVRLARIKNTMLLDELEASENLLEEVRANPHLDILSEPYDFKFDRKGNLA